MANWESTGGGGGFVNNPMSDLIDGIMQGQQLKMQLHRQQQQDQAFKTQQILDNQRIDSETIMQQMRHAGNMQKLGEDYNPVSDLGTVQDKMNLTIPGSAGNPGSLGAGSVGMLRTGEQQPDIYNLPQQGGAAMPGPQFNTERKADGTRTITYQGQKFERKTPEELQARDLQRHIGEQSALEKASVKAKGEAEESELDRKRTLRGVPIPADLAGSFPAAQYPHGLLEQEIMSARAGIAAQRKADETIIPKEGTLFDRSTGKVVATGAPKDLSEPEQVALSAAQRVAAVHKIPFDRTLNPQDPRAQIPTSLHGEVDAVIARAKTDPAVAAQLAATRSLQAEAITGRREDQRTNATNRRNDQSYTLNTRELDNMRKPVDQSVQKIGELQDMLNQNSPEADALVGPKLVSVLAGGLNSGVRVNKAEIERAMGGQSKWEDLKKAINKWTLDPKSATSIMPEQRRQIRALVQLAADKATTKQKALDDAGTDLIAHEDPTEHRKIVDKARKALSGIDQGQQAAPAGGTIRYTSGGRAYNIPAAQEADFLKDHPGAQK